MSAPSKQDSFFKRHPVASYFALTFAVSWLGDLAVAAAPPQEPSAKSPPPATLRVTTRLIEINVIVHDKHGNPIAGLTKNDFVLLDNKKSQAIQFFSAENNPPLAQPAASLPPDTYSNRLGTSGTLPPSVTVILLDALNTEFADQAFARKQVAKFLQKLRPQDRVALYWLGNDLYVLHEFTTDVSVLREALAHFAGESSRDLTEVKVEDLSLDNPNSSLPAGVPAGQTSSRQAFRAAFDQRIANQSAKNRVRLTVAAMIAIAHHVGSLKGRKNLVWVSGSFPFNLGNETFDLNWASETGEDFAGDIERAAQALTDASIAVYPVEARGLMGTDLSATDSSDAHPEFSSEGDEHLPTNVAPGNLETMKVLAARTGGTAFYGSNDLAGPIQRAIDDSRVTYTLGYYPAQANWDGSFHNIKVSVKTRGAQVRARTGYFAIPDPTEISAKFIQALIAQTARSQLDATEIGIHIHLQPLNDPRARIMTADLHLDLPEIHMEQNNGLWTGAIQTVFLQLGKQGEILHVDDQTFKLDLPPAQYDQSLKNGVKEMQRIEVLPNATRLCVVLRDPSNGNLGSLSISLAKYFPAPSAPAN